MTNQFLKHIIELDIMVEFLPSVVLLSVYSTSIVFWIISLRSALRGQVVYVLSLYGLAVVLNQGGQVWNSCN